MVSLRDKFDEFIQLEEQSNIFGLLASNIDLSQVKSPDLPEQIRDEIPTLNQFGYMKEEMDELAQKFIKFATEQDNLVMEIGTAYGWLAEQVLKKKIQLIANDISSEHLAYLLHRIEEKNLSRLHIYPASFPEEVELPSKSLSAVMCSRVMHFYKGEEIEMGLDKIHQWLTSGGKLFLSSCSIYHYSVIDRVGDVYRAKKERGEKWPGLIYNQKESAPEHAPYVHDLFHVFDVPQLEALLPRHGFEIEEIKLFDYPNDTYSEGRGHVGLIARKV